CEFLCPPLCGCELCHRLVVVFYLSSPSILALLASSSIPSGVQTRCSALDLTSLKLALWTRCSALDLTSLDSTLSSLAATELESTIIDWLGQEPRLPKEFLFYGGGVMLGTTCKAILATLVATRDR
ncbi:hypothetical protein HN873_008033, partial [Arachis hypogaea]